MQSWFSTCLISLYPSVFQPVHLKHIVCSSCLHLIDTYSLPPVPYLFSISAFPNMNHSAYRRSDSVSMLLCQQTVFRYQSHSLGCLRQLFYFVLIWRCSVYLCAVWFSVCLYIWCVLFCDEQHFNNVTIIPVSHTHKHTAYMYTHMCECTDTHTSIWTNAFQISFATPSSHINDPYNMSFLHLEADKSPTTQTVQLMLYNVQMYQSMFMSSFLS